MTRHYFQRCEHCSDVYNYQGSGPGCNTQLNDSRHCPVCKAAVIEALSGIPAKRKQVWEVPEDVTFEMVKAWDEAHEAEMKAKGALRIRRLWPGLVNMQTGATQRIYGVSGRGEYAGRYFRYWQWSDDSEPPKVEEQLELVIATGETRPWKEYRRT
jgi:hypothetical protein